MKISESIFRRAACCPKKIIYQLILVNVFLTVFAVTQVYASGLTVSPATISETYRNETTNQKTLTLVNNTNDPIEFTVLRPWWMSSNVNSGTLANGAETSFNVDIKVSDGFPFGRQQEGDISIFYTVSGETRYLTVPIKINVNKEGSLWDLDGDRFPGLFEEKYGTSDDPSGGRDVHPVYSATQSTGPKYFRVDDDLAEETTYEKKTIQAALDAAESDGNGYTIIEVLPGVYLEDIVMPETLSVFLFANNHSGFARDGEMPYVVVNGVDESAYWDGDPAIEVNGNNVVIDGFNVGENDGVGVEIKADNVSIRYCEVYGNAGIGIQIEWSSSNIEIQSSKIYRNNSSGIYLGDRGNILIKSCEIYYNTSEYSGGGITGGYEGLSDVCIEDTRIYNNSTGGSGGGISLDGSGGGFDDVEIKNSLLYCNSAQKSGGAIDAWTVWGGGVKLTNSIIFNNKAAEEGGGIYSANADFEFVETTLLNNNAKLGSEIYAWGDEGMELTNSIVWNYINDENVFVAVNSVSVKNSIIQSSIDYIDAGGVSNEDPKLTALGFLTKDSSAIDRGVNADLAFDIQGEDRPYPAGGESDIGADEFIDSDADGLPDFWVERYFGDSPVDPVDFDADGDSLTTLEEYVWGMDPAVKLFQDIRFDGQPLNDGDAIAAVGELQVRLDNEQAISSVEFVVEDAAGQKALSYTDDKVPFVLSVDTTNITDPGSYTFRIKVFNHRGEFVEEVRMGIQVGNNKAPVITAIEDAEVVEGDVFTCQVEATDSDGDDALLSYAVSLEPETASLGLSINSSGLLTFDTSVKQNLIAGGNFTITVTVTDADLEEPRSATTDFNFRIFKVIKFQNSIIEGKIRELLGIPASAQILETDIRQLSGVLDFSGLDLVNITDLSALKYATNIVGLNLSGNKITNLAPLQGLTQLKTLDLSNNQISDISLLVGLNNLTTLNLGTNLLDLDAGDEDAMIIDQFIENGVAVDSSNQIRFTVDVSVIGGGTVRLSPDQRDYGYKDYIQVISVPDGDNLFVGWTGTINTSGRTKGTSFLISNNWSLTAEFAAGVAEGTGDGLIVDTYGYFDNPAPGFWDSFNGPGYRSLLANEILMSGSPAYALTGRNGYYSGRLVGKLEARYTGAHTFHANFDPTIDTVVYLNGERIINNHNALPAGDRTRTSDPINLIAGQTYEIEIFYRSINERVFHLYWTLPDSIRQRIPRSQLYSGFEFTTDTPAFASAVTAEYFDPDGSPLNISNSALEFGLGALPLGSGIALSAGVGESIRYTLDGSEPDANAPVYNRPIAISGNTTLKARAYSATAVEGAVFTGVYTVDNASPLLFDLQLPDVAAAGGVSADTVRVGDNLDQVISINAQDDSSITRVRFYLTNANTGNTVFLGTDEQGVPEASGERFEVPFNIFNFADGDWNLKIIATDFFGNETTFEQGIRVIMAMPEAPVILQPLNNSGFANGQIAISGTARIDCTVQMQARLVDSDGNPLAGTAGNFATLGSPVAVSSSGEFSLTHSFADNQDSEQYELRAVAIGRNGSVSPASATVKISVDSTIPSSPVNLTARTQAGGDIRISWDPPLTYSGIIRSYRIQVSEDNGLSWSLLNEVSGDVNTYLYEYSDQTGSPPHVFRVLAVNAANTATPGSEAQFTPSVVPDEAAPQFIQLEWIPQDGVQFDADDSKYGPGLLTVQIEVNEAVSETPYLALKPPGLGLPYRVDLIAVTDRIFEGAVVIKSGMPSGDYHILAALVDFAGNQSRSDDPSRPPLVDGLETTLAIDTKAPQIADLDPEGRSIFKNEAAGTVLSYTFNFDEALRKGFTPVAGAEWGDGTSVNSGNVTLQDLGAGSYQVDVLLSPSDGYDGSAPNPNPTVEQAFVNQALLTVLLEVEDTVGNSGFAEIPSVLVYRNSLPQTAPPDLRATVLPGGKVLLEWKDVPDADGYRLMRVDSPADEALAVVTRDFEEVAGYEYTYTAPLDGAYSFYVYGEREDPLNPGTYIAGYSMSPVTVETDSTAPEPARMVEIEDANPSNPNAALRLHWQHPDANGVDHFDLYRTDVNPAGAAAVDPSWTLIRKNIDPSEKETFDSKPFAGLAWYIVVASDSVGNEALALNFPTSDITIVPPAEVKISLAENKFPVLSWTAVDAITNSTEGSYSVYQGASGPDVELTTGLTTLEFTDTTWDGKPRTYWIESVKGEFRSVRNIVLHDYTLDLLAETTLYRGLPTPVKLNKMPNDSWNFRVHLSRKEEGDASLVYSGELNKPLVDFGLNADGSYAERQYVLVQLETWPKSDKDFGESTWFEIEHSLPVEDRLPSLSLESDSLSRGTTASNIKLSVRNPSGSDIKVKFSEGHVVLKLYDAGGNLLSQSGLSDEADRTIPGKESLTVESLEMAVPENAPDTVILQAELSQYSNPQTGQLFTPAEPVTTRLTLSTVQLSYAAEITSPKADDAVSLLTSESLEITGRAVDRNGTPRAAALVTLGLENGEYKRTVSLVTDSRGDFKYTFDPNGAEPGGLYTVWAKHPERSRAPSAPEAAGAFTYKRIAISPDYHTVRIPRNYTQGVPITLTWPEDTRLSDFTVETVTFSGEALPAGLSITVPSVSDPAAGETSLEIIPQILPRVQAGAPNEANLLFRISAKIEGAAEATVLGEVPVYCYFSQTFGQLTGPSKLISLSVLRAVDGGVTTSVQDDVASFSFVNTGLIPLTGLRFNVMQKVLREGSTVAYAPAPKWLELTGVSTDTLPVGEAIKLQLTTNLASQPDSSLPANGTYGNYVILAESAEAPSAVAAVELNVTSDSNSGLEVHVINAYYRFDPSTLPDGGAGLNIPSHVLETYQYGVPGAKITLQQDDLQSAINSTGWTIPLVYKANTGEDGKVSEWKNPMTGETLPSIPSGRYQVSVEAPRHGTYKGVVVIKPGMTGFEQIPLSYGAVTVEWEVREITLQDRYEVTIETIFETEVPAPVVTMTPAYVELPDMCPGDVFEVELIIENHGFISALNMENPIPRSDEYLKIEPLVDLGPIFDLPAKQSRRIAYRCICVKALPDSKCN